MERSHRDSQRIWIRGDGHNLRPLHCLYVFLLDTLRHFEYGSKRIPVDSYRFAYIYLASYTYLKWSLCVWGLCNTSFAYFFHLSCLFQWLHMGLNTSRPMVGRTDRTHEQIGRMGRIGRIGWTHRTDRSDGWIGRMDGSDCRIGQIGWTPALFVLVGTCPSF